MIPLESRFSKLLVLTGISIVLGLIVPMIGMFLSSVIFGLDLAEVGGAMSRLDSEQDVLIAKILLIFNSLGLFVIPALLFAFFFEKSPSHFFQFNNTTGIKALPLVVIIFISFMPVVNLTVSFNKALVLPDFLSELELWMRLAEDKATELTAAFLVMESTSDLLFNVFLIGVLPAVGEELLFRGVIQKTLTRGRQNYHWGIWGAAMIFSLLHFQFFGFLPRLLLGALFGYLFHWSKNIWVPIFAHFLNNTTAVIASYYLNGTNMEKQVDTFGSTSESYIYSIFSALILIGLLFLFKKKFSQTSYPLRG